MSPLPVRRYRAERLLRKEFESLRGRVLATVRGRLRVAGVSLDTGDLEACYAQAWHGLYTTVLEGGEEIANRAGWLALVTYRRAIDEHRAHGARVAPIGDASEPSPPSSPGVSSVGDVHSQKGPFARASHARAKHPFGETYEHDLAGDLDDRIRLRRLLEGLRGRLTPRERQAAALCYLQGLSRADAAARMGIGEARMRKLMDGPHAGAPGVAGKVGELLRTIREGAFCAEQASLMRGFAYGIHDPNGERHELAVAHWRECSACRGYVLSLRGLAAVLPPPPLPLALGAGVAAGAGAGTAGVGVGAGTGTGAGVAGVGAGTAGAGGAAAGGVAGAGGGWFLAGGGLGAKLAVGCLLAVSVGAGCVALTGVPVVLRHAPRSQRRRAAQATDRGGRLAREAVVGPLTDAGQAGAAGAPATARTAAASATASSALTAAAKASREFGPEQPASGASASTRTKPSVAHAARAAVDAATSTAAGGEAEPAPTSASARPAGGGSAGDGGSAGGPSAAAREFGLG